MNWKIRKNSIIIATSILSILFLSCDKKHSANTDAIMDHSLTINEILKLDKKDCDKYNGLQYDKSQLVINPKNDTIHLAKLLDNSDKTTLIIRFSSYSCSSCINYLLSKITPAIENLDIGNCLIIIANVFVGDLHVMQKDYKNIKLYKSDSLVTDFDMALTPYLFFIDRNNVIQDFYIPRKEVPDDMETYLRHIRGKYTRNKEENQTQ